METGLCNKSLEIINIEMIMLSKKQITKTKAFLWHFLTKNQQIGTIMKKAKNKDKVIDK